MDSLRVPRFLILFCAVSWVVVQQSMQSASPHELSTDVQHVGSPSTPAEVLDMGDGQKSEGADTVDHLGTQVQELKEEQKKRRVKRFFGGSRRSESDNRARHPQACRIAGPRRFCETTGHCGWKNLSFEILVMEEGRVWAVQLENGKGRGFLKSELACHTGGETNCLMFDYKMDEPNMDELLVFLDQQKTTPVTLWRTRAADVPRGWQAASIAIKSSTTFQVEIRAIRCDPEQKSLSRVALRNILYRQGQCANTPAVEPPYDSPCEASSPGSRHTSVVTLSASSTSDSTVTSTQNTPVTSSVLTTSGMSTEMTSVPDAGKRVDDDDDHDDDDDDDKKGVVIAVVVSCALVVMALLVMAIVCWRRRSRKRTASAPSTVMSSGAHSQDDPPAGRQNEAGPPRPTAAQGSTPADEDYSHLNSHRPRPTRPERTSEDTYNHVTAATRARSPAAAHAQNFGNTSEDTYNHLAAAPSARSPATAHSQNSGSTSEDTYNHLAAAPSARSLATAHSQHSGNTSEDTYKTAATRARSPATAHSQHSDNTSEDTYNHLAAASSASSPTLGQSDNTYTEANEVRAPDLTAATSRRLGAEGDYNHFNLGGRGAGVEAESVEECKLYDGLRAEKGDVYDHVRRGRKEEVIDETYSHI